MGCPQRDQERGGGPAEGEARFFALQGGVVVTDPATTCPLRTPSHQSGRFLSCHRDCHPPTVLPEAHPGGSCPAWSFLQLPSPGRREAPHPTLGRPVSFGTVIEARLLSFAEEP